MNIHMRVLSGLKKTNYIRMKRKTLTATFGVHFVITWNGCVS